MFKESNQLHSAVSAAKGSLEDSFISSVQQIQTFDKNFTFFPHSNTQWNTCLQHKVSNLFLKVVKTTRTFMEGIFTIQVTLGGRANNHLPILQLILDMNP